MTLGDPTDLTMAIRGQNAEQIQSELDAAVELAIKHARRTGCQGVLVTQHSFTSFSVALNPNVPYGQTHEYRAQETAGMGAAGVAGAK